MHSIVTLPYRWKHLHVAISTRSSCVQQRVRVSLPQPPNLITNITIPSDWPSNEYIFTITMKRKSSASPERHRPSPSTNDPHAPAALPPSTCAKLNQSVMSMFKGTRKMDPEADLQPLFEKYVGSYAQRRVKAIAKVETPSKVVEAPVSTPAPGVAFSSTVHIDKSKPHLSYDQKRLLNQLKDTSLTGGSKLRPEVVNLFDLLRESVLPPHPPFASVYHSASLKPMACSPNPSGAASSSVSLQQL
jgi:hypothetical protein